jgi:hypothetical protein
MSIQGQSKKYSLVIDFLFLPKYDELIMSKETNKTLNLTTLSNAAENNI